MRLMRHLLDMYVDIVATHYKGGLQLWIDNCQRDIPNGKRLAWSDYNDFRVEFICTFEPTTDAELAHQHLEGFK